MRVFRGRHILVSPFGNSIDLIVDFSHIVFACLNAGIIPAVYMFFPGKLIISLPEGRAYQPPFIDRDSWALIRRRVNISQFPFVREV